MYLKEMGYEGVNWTGQAQNRETCRAAVDTVMNFRVPLVAENFLAYWLLKNESVSWSYC